jgi:hypothetical protein
LDANLRDDDRPCRNPPYAQPNRPCMRLFKHPLSTGEAEQIVLKAIRPNFLGNLWNFAEQVAALGIKDIGSPAQRPSAQDALNELNKL